MWVMLFKIYQVGYGVVRELVGHGLEKMHEDPEMPNYGKDEENFCRRYGGCHRTDDQHGN
jgi:methionine aminopeptidase